MTTIEALLARLRQLDVRLSVDGDRLVCNAPKGALTPELRAALGERKEEIKAYLRKAADGDAALATIARVPREPEMPLSHAQQRLWFLKQLDATNAAYNVAGVIRFRGRLDVEILDRSFRKIIARHESLRTRFISRDGQPRAVIEPQADWRLSQKSVSSLPPEERDAEARRLAAAAIAAPFDLTRCPLFAAELIRISDDEHLLALVLDHIIADGWSATVLGRELFELYTAELTGRAARLPPVSVQYVDYAAWQSARLQSELLDTQLPYWLDRLRGTLPVLQLPTDRPRPSVQQYRGSRVVRVIPSAVLTTLKAAARREGVTLFMLLLAGFKALLARYTGEDDVIVGSAAANRERAEVEGIIGFFVNNIVLRSDLSGNPSVRELLGRVKEVCLGAYAHQDVPFDVLVDRLRLKRELDHSPIFQAMFVLQNLPYPEVALPGVVVSSVDVDPDMARFDLAMDAFESPQGLKLMLEYNRGLFDRDSMERMLEHYQVLLEDLAARPEAGINELRMLADEEAERLVQEWNRTEHDYPRESTLHALFEAQADRTPRSEAAVFNGHSITYHELDERANRLAHVLREEGVGPDVLVGIWMDRSIEMLVSLLAILKAGGGYVPLDPAFPKDRIDYMMADSGLTLVLTQARLAATLGADAPRTIVVDDEGDRERLERAPADRPTPLAGPSSLAYVIYTSGSTGKPKGVQLEHRSVVNFLTSMHREPGIGPCDHFLSVTTLSFDIAGLEIFGPLTVGGTVILADRATALDGQRLAELMEQSGASIMQATPATWRLLLESGWSDARGMKILCGGEALPLELAEQLLATGGELWNLYGPTETTIWSTAARIEPGNGHPGIGRPIANTRVYILDAQRRPVPIGVPGELYIGGDGLARGYLNRPELTEERFVPDPFSARPEARMYRTGDLARWRPDGTIHCLGRVDQQVKIRGYRIELGEVEAALARHPDVAQTVVVAKPDSSGEQRLAAYLIMAPGTTLEPAAMRRFLATGLPEYMIPSVFVALDAFPLTPNGKVDRKALPAPDAQSIAVSTAYASPENETEAVIAAIWQEVLKLERVGRNDNFFDLGGHSLLVVQVQSRIQKLLGRSVMLVELFQHPTVAALAAFLQGGAETDSLSLVRERAARQKAARTQQALAT